MYENKFILCDNKNATKQKQKWKPLIMIANNDEIIKNHAIIK